MEELLKVDLYTDGACSENPGMGGWAYCLICKNKIKSESGFCPNTTNNQMELLAVINGLKALKKECEVNIRTDSAYIFNTFTLGWLEKWKQNGFVNSKRQPVANKEMFLELESLVKKHKVTWFKCHAHTDDYYNNLCDKLATDEIKKQKENK